MGQTRQKQAILSVLQQEQRPLTRDELLRLGREKVPRLGAATVNRAIRELTERHALIGVDFPGQPTRYELPAPDEHPHFICRVCERVYDLPLPLKLPHARLPEGFCATGGEVIYTGTCPQCSGQPAQQKPPS